MKNRLFKVLSVVGTVVAVASYGNGGYLPFVNSGSSTNSTTSSTSSGNGSLTTNSSTGSLTTNSSTTTGSTWGGGSGSLTTNSSSSTSSTSSGNGSLTTNSSSGSLTTNSSSGFTTPPASPVLTTLPCNDILINKVKEIKKWYMVGAPNKGCNLDDLTKLGYSAFFYENSTNTYRSTGTIDVADGIWLLRTK